MIEHTMPIQPIHEGRFVPNRIVELLLETSTHDLNTIACGNFTDQERIQFAQLIGYSVSGFGTLSYVDDDTYNAVELIADQEITQEQAEILSLRKTLDNIRTKLRAVVSAAFRIDGEDLDVR